MLAQLFKLFTSLFRSQKSEVLGHENARENAVAVINHPVSANSDFNANYVQLSPIEAVELFLLNLKNTGSSHSTVKNYSSDLHQYLNVLPGLDLPQIFDQASKDVFIREQQSKNLKESSIQRKLVSLQQFKRWLEKERLLSPGVVTAITPPIDPPPPTFTAITAPKAPSAHRRSFAFFGASKSPIASAWKGYRQLPFSRLIEMSLLTVFITSLTVFGYRQFFSQAPINFAYPTSPVTPNRIMSFQGRLTSAAGNPITTATDVDFRLYNASTVGTELWDSGTCSIDPDQDGIFNTILGSTCGTEISEDVFSENDEVWLEIEVDTEILTPRQRIATVPYALNTETVQGFPVTATESATINSLLVMNEWGEVILGENSPKLRSVSGTFTIEGANVSITTTNNGNITLDPDGTGITNVVGNLVQDGYLYTNGATISATYANSTPLIINGTGGQIVSVNNSGDITTAGDLAINGGDLTSTGDLTINVAGGNVIFADGDVLNVGGASAQAYNFFAGSTGGNSTADGDNDLYIEDELEVDGAVRFDNSSITFSTFTNNGGLLYTNGSGVVAQTDVGSAGECLQSNGGGTPTWGSCTSGGGASKWNIASGTVQPINTTLDFLVGGTATTSAKFAVINVNSGTPTATLSAGVAGGAYLNATGTLQTTDNQHLTLGGDTTGNISLLPGNSAGSIIADLGAGTLFNILDGNLKIGNGTPGLTQDGEDGYIEGTFEVDGQAQFDGNVDATNGLDVTTANLTVGGANFTVAPGTGNITSAGDLALNGDDLTSDGNLSIAASGYVRIGDTGTPGTANGDDDLYVEGDLEIDGGTILDGSLTANGQFTLGDNGDTGAINTSDWDISTTGAMTGFSFDANGTGNSITNIENADLADDTLDFDKFQDTLDVDATTDINLGTNDLYVDLDSSGVFSIRDGSTSFVTFDDDSTIDVVFPAAGMLGIDASSTANTTTGGVIDLNVAAGNAAVIGQNIDFTQNSGADAGTDAIAQALNLTANDADGDVFGTVITANATANAGAGSYEALLKLVNAENTASTVTDAILIDSTSGTDGDIVDAIDASDANITNALNFGANTILGTTGNIDMDNFDVVGSSGNITTAGDLAVNGDDITADGNLSLSATGYVRIGDTGTPGTATGDDALYVQGALEIDGAVVFDNSSFTLSTFTTNGGILYTNGSGVVAQTTAGDSGQCLQSVGGGTPTWGACGSGGASYWTLANGSLYPINSTLDLFVGGTSTSSAKFAVLNVNSGTPTASVSAGTDGAAYLTAAGVLQTTQNQTLTLGGDTTGNLLIHPDAFKRVGVNTSTLTGGFNIASSGDVSALVLTAPDVAGQPAFSVQELPASTDVDSGKAFEFKVTGESFGRGMFYSDGAYGIGPGNATRDVYIRRSAANTLMIDSNKNGGTAHLSVTGDVAINGDDLTSDGNLSISATGYTRIGDNATPETANSDDDLFVEGELEVDNAANFDGSLFANAGVVVDNDNLTVGGSNFVVDYTNGNITTTGDLAVNGDDITSDGDLTLNPAGGQVLLADGDVFNIGGVTGQAYNAISDSGTASFASSDDDLYIEDILEVSGTLYIGGTAVSPNSLWGNTLNVYHPANAYAGIADLAIGGTATASATFHVRATDGAISNGTGTTVIVNDDLQVSGNDLLGSTGETRVSFNDGTDTTLVSGILQTSGNLDVDGTSNDIAGALNLSGNSLTSSGDLTINATGGNILFADNDVLNVGGASAQAYNFFAGSTAGNGNADGDNDLYIEDELEVDGNFYLGGSLTGPSTLTLATTTTLSTSLTTFTCTDCINFDDMSDSLTLDAATTITNALAGNLTIDLTSTGDFVIADSSSAVFTFTDGGALTQAGSGQITFTGNVDATNGLDVTTANLTVGGSNFTVAPGTGNVTTAGDVAINGGDLTSTATTFNFDIGNTGTLNFRDGTNALVAIKDQGTYAHLNLAGKSTTGDPGTCAEGDIYYNANDDTIKICHASNTWESLDGGVTNWNDIGDPTGNNTINLSTNLTQFDFTGTTTTGWTFNADSLTTGIGQLFSFDGLTSGTGLSLASTSTAWTSGKLATLDWSPTGSTEIFSTGTLLNLNVGQYGNLSKIFNIQDNGSDVFSVSQAKITSALPHEFTAAGDVSIAYDLVLTNQTASNIKSSGPLTLEAGESFENNDLTLKTYGTGSVVVDGKFSIGIQRTLPVNDTTPSVAAGNSFVTANTGATAITFLDDGTVGQIVAIEINDANTDFDCTGTNLNCGSGDMDIVVAGDVVYWMFDGTQWNLLNWMDDSQDYGTAGADLAEYIPASEALLPGEVVSVDTTQPVTVKKANQADGKRVLGVVSTEPGIVLGPETPNSYPIALVGRVPVKISPNSQAIQIGDPITSSTDTGKAVKATQAGQIIGQAMESWTPNSGQDSIIVFVNLSWYQPQVVMTNNGEVVISQAGQTYQVEDEHGNLITQIGQFAEAIIGQIQAGLISTQKLIADRIIVNQKLESPLIEAGQVATDLLSPLSGEDLTIDLKDTPNNTSELIVTGDNNQPVFSVNEIGNATLSGQLNTNSVNAGSVRSQVLAAQQAELDALEVKDATLSGNLYLKDGRTLDQILADNEAFLASMSGQPTSPAAADFQEFLTQLTGSQDASVSAMLSQLQQNNQVSLSEDNVILAPDAVFIHEFLGVNGFAQVNSMNVQQLSVNSNLLFTYNSISTLTGTLEIQPQGIGSINLLAGLMTLSDDGKVQINGDLTVTGKVIAQGGVETTQINPNFGTDLNVKLATESGQILGETIQSSFNILDASNSAVASINASGSAQFNQVAAQGLTIKKPISQAEDQIQQTIEIQRKQTAGNSVLNSGTTELLIENDNIKPNSLVYLTATSDPQGQVLFVKTKQTCTAPENQQNQAQPCQTSFTIGINNPVLSPIAFNYWIVNVE